ncbi:hypothetical protein P9112_014253 [Eukaryota sp. TZLM1-RC]
MSAPLPAFLGEKKKKKKKVREASEVKTLKTAMESSATTIVEEEVSVAALQASEESPYAYKRLLSRLYENLQARNPELLSDRKKLVMKPPRVHRDTGRKTVWSNFKEIAGLLKRNPEHLMHFFLAEMGTTASVDGSDRLLIRGRYNEKEIEFILRNYIMEFVLCKICKSADTQLHKESKLYFVNCNCCGATRSVQTIQKGFTIQKKR